MKHALFTAMRAKLVLIAAVVATAGFGLAGCGDQKKDEDVAAIRKMMEDKKAQEEEAKRKDAQAYEEMKRKNEETRKKLGI